MTLDTGTRIRSLRTKLISAAILLACAPAAAQSPNATPEIRVGRAAVIVANCDDSGPGSLRAALAAATDGDTVDLTQLSCSAITLTTGALVTSNGSITIAGPGSAALSISGSNSDTVLKHASLGALTVSGVTLTDGSNSQPTYADGGCLSSQGSASLYDVVLTNCHAETRTTQRPSIWARGGGVFTAGDLTLVRSKVSGSTASTAVLTSPGVGSYMYARGGGIYTRGILTMRESTVSGNTARVGNAPFGGVYCEGGGVFARTGLSVASSTIDGNSADDGAGLWSSSSGAPQRIINSTISGNHAALTAGGIRIIGPAVEILNSTIAFNTASEDPSDPAPSGAGLRAFNSSLRLESTIIANNSAGPLPDDFSHDPGAPLSGSNNLIATSRFAPPAGTITDDPVLLPLADNGGPTATHALGSGSPAVGHGNNNEGLDYDERGVGYPRVSGGLTDIGAYEYQAPEAVFSDGFDAVPISDS